MNKTINIPAKESTINSIKKFIEIKNERQRRVIDKIRESESKKS